MMKYKAVSVFLVLLISVLCPAACGLRAALAEEITPTTDCCGHPLPRSDGPQTPVHPTDHSSDSCFCSTEGVTFDKVGVSTFPALLLPFANDSMDDVALNTRLVARVHEPSFFHPPGHDRLLPLLI